MKSNIVLLAVLLVIVSVAAAFMMNQNAPSAEEKIAVALFFDDGSNNPTNYDAMLRAVGCDVTIIDSRFINNESLDSFSILCMPGSSSNRYTRDISPTGRQKIRNFVRNGGGYIGICGGAYLACESSRYPEWYLGLFPGVAGGPIDEIAVYPNDAIAQVNVVNSTHPITQGGPATYWIYYSGGPFFVPNTDADVTILGSYEVGGQPAMTANKYGSGRVFTIGVHPEGSGGPNWELVRRAVLWLTED